MMKTVSVSRRINVPAQAAWGGHSRRKRNGPMGSGHHLLHARGVTLVQALSAPRPTRNAGAKTGAPTALVCGVFLLRDVRLNPLFQALPRALVSIAKTYTKPPGC